MYRINRARHGWQANQLAHPTTARPSGCWDVGSANAKESTERELRDTDYGTLVTCGRPLNPPQCHREEITAAEAILPHRLAWPSLIIGLRIERNPAFPSPESHFPPFPALCGPERKPTIPLPTNPFLPCILAQPKFDRGVAPGLVAESHLMHCKERYQSRSREFAQPSNPGWIQNPDKEDE
ncbi:predicted protein [Coccidioides posadasii str. Silveira]|uniref:Predicted protein n=1 Tax=Coccidioides posadasii (strain RMSCC 757 / Silveira) TaxID=443226 RepID=E9CVB2_COCPS|nr:predicted protein [Coccidioides posadasii str. Silveira]